MTSIARIFRHGSGQTTVLLALMVMLAAAASASELRLEVRDASGQVVPARVHLRDSGGKSVKVPGLPFWYDHVACTGAMTCAVSPGTYRWEIERGPEWSTATGSVTLAEGETRSFTNSVRQIADMAREGWWSGETHVHRGLHDAELLMRAEDLHAAQFMTWWNKVNSWANQALPKVLPTAFDETRTYFQLGGEDERDGGALLFMDLDAPLNITNGTRNFPSSLVYAKQARERGAKWIDAEKPFWWDYPMWVAHGMVDTVGIAHNHMHRGGVLDNEAWGRPRDLRKYPGPRGNGFYTQDIYYHLLNTGVRLPPSAGSASGVLPNPVGYNRVYVQLNGEFTYEKWRDGLKRGRSFVSNGPLLRCRANGEFRGAVLKSDQPIEVQIEGELNSRDPISTVELVHNGRVEAISLPHRFMLRESGWFLVRAIADVTNTFRFASTAPWYAEIGGQPMKPRADAAQYFVDWSNERMERLRALDSVSDAQKEELLQPWREAKTYWTGKITNTASTSVPGEDYDLAAGRVGPSRIYIQNGNDEYF